MADKTKNQEERILDLYALSWELVFDGGIEHVFEEISYGLRSTMVDHTRSITAVRYATLVLMRSRSWRA
jgi:hypothetical protein